MRGTADISVQAGGGPPDTDGEIEVVVSGELDLTTVSRVAAVLDSALGRRPVRLVIDLAACRHVDAAGIALLLDTHRRMWRMGGRVSVRQPSSRIRRIFTASQVDNVLEVDHLTVRRPAPSGSAAHRAHRAADTPRTGG